MLMSGKHNVDTRHLGTQQIALILPRQRFGRKTGIQIPFKPSMIGNDNNVGMFFVPEVQDPALRCFQGVIEPDPGDMVVTDPMRVRLKDSPLIEFINRVQMELSGALISNTALFDNSSPGFPANVTMRDIVSNYIYPNTLKVIRITGQDIKDALEQSASYFKTYTGGQVEVSDKFRTPKPQHYNYDMWEGITYRLNISRPVGERVVQLDYEGSPIDLSATFDVVLNNYRAGGGGNYTMFQGKPVVKDIPTDVAELLASYIMERGTIEAACNDNWEVVHD
jgi:2',3'-cyclic-nucleotide 2'-phosphodiesterase/3'-nucleotidase